MGSCNAQNIDFKILVCFIDFLKFTCCSYYNWQDAFYWNYLKQQVNLSGHYILAMAYLFVLAFIKHLGLFYLSWNLPTLSHLQDLCVCSLSV